MVEGLVGVCGAWEKSFLMNYVYICNWGEPHTRVSALCMVSYRIFYWEGKMLIRATGTCTHYSSEILDAFKYQHCSY